MVDTTTALPLLSIREAAKLRELEARAKQLPPKPRATRLLKTISNTEVVPARVPEFASTGYQSKMSLMISLGHLRADQADNSGQPGSPVPQSIGSGRASECFCMSKAK